VATAYSLTPPVAPGGAWIFQTIYTFTNTGIIEPVSLVLVDGALYGTSFMGGISSICQESYVRNVFLTDPSGKPRRDVGRQHPLQLSRRKSSRVA
jgi:hypothetical protein